MARSKKWFLTVSLMLIIAMITAGCGGNAGNGTTPGSTDGGNSDKTYTIRWTALSVPNDAHTKAMEIFKEELEKSTNGQIKVEVYHSGSLFNADTETQALMRGNVEMAYTSAAILANYLPTMAMFTAGYTFKDYDHMTKTLNGEIGQQLFTQVIEKTGTRPLGAFYLGSRQLNYKDIGRTIEKPEDMKGVKLRMPNSPAWLFLGQALGGNPTPLAFSELYLALSSGTVDMQDNPLPTVQNAKFYEVAKNITLTGHVVDAIFPTINEKFWQSLTPELQQKIVDALAVAQKYCDETNLKAESELIEFFKTQGVKVNTPDVEAFREYVQNAYKNDPSATKDWDMELYNKVQSLAE